VDQRRPWTFSEGSHAFASPHYDLRDENRESRVVDGGVQSRRLSLRDRYHACGYRMENYGSEICEASKVDARADETEEGNTACRRTRLGTVQAGYQPEHRANDGGNPLCEILRQDLDCPVISVSVNVWRRTY
jgi:hypothetical protein